MAKIPLEIKRFSGLSESEKEGGKSTFLWAESVNYRSEPNKLTLLPRTVKESGSVVVDLVMAGDRQGTNTYLIGNAGNLYKHANNHTWTNLRTIANNSGNGLKYYGEDGYLYYPSDKVIGRYGPLTSTPTFVDDFLGAEGGIPTNTHSLTLNGTTQYATAPDSASLSQTSDISQEIFVKLSSLPAVGETKTLVSKWLKNGNQRSYNFYLNGISGYFGNGSDGAYTVSINTTDTPIDSACTGTAAASTLSATNASFAVGQLIMIHQTQGTGAGKWERRTVNGYTAGTITLDAVLSNSYTTGAQVLVFKQYTNVTINSGITLTAKAWNGTVGGILGFVASGTITGTGTISGTGKGFRGGTAGATTNALQGEGTPGLGANELTAANGNGGGAGSDYQSGSGGGGGNGVAGVNGGGSSSWGYGGSVVGTTDLTTMLMGGGGGGARVGGGHAPDPGNAGGAGGAIIFISGTTITITGSIISGGVVGATSWETGGGGGAGGSILIKAQTATLGSALITAPGAAGGVGNTNSGGAGGAGRINLDYYTSYTGTTTPTINVINDQGLVTTTSHQMTLAISSNGTNEEFLTKTISAGLISSQWYRFGVTWKASTSLATFYVDAVTIGNSTGTLTSIYNSTALYAIGASFNAAGAAENFLPAKVDDVRLWSDVRTAGEQVTNNLIETSGGSANLVAYHQLDNALTDETSGANTLTNVATAVFTTDVPFSAPTTRRDLDQELNTSGNTYTLTTAISEAATHRQTFVPAKDPQKTLEVNIAAKGTGNWTLTIHDALNKEVAVATVLLANLNTGDYEFTLTAWTPLIGASYHFHLTSTVADGTVVTTTASDLETADFHTYYQFLVDSDYHHCEQIGNKLAIANGRYIATWDGAIYNPHAITLPSGFNIRCLGLWRGYLVAGIALGNNIFDYDYGFLFMWDGTSKTYNDFVPVKQGAVNSIISGEPLGFVAGYSGDYCEFNGGEVKVIKRMPRMTDKKYIEVAPKATCTWRSLVHLGMGLNTDSADFSQGVYAYGQISDVIPPSLSYDYPLSIGIKKATGLRIGMTYPVGKELMISWQYNTTYGIDVVSPDNSPFLSGRYESLISDLGKISNEKLLFYLRSYFKKLVSGDAISNEIKLDRNDSWTPLGTENTADKKELRTQLPNNDNRFNEFQVSTIIATTNTTSPEYYGTALEFDDLAGESRI